MEIDDITCGDDCRGTRLEKTEHGMAWVDFEGHTVALAVDGKCTRGFCNSCGRKVGFANDGKPVIGPRYDELERDNERMDALEECRLLGTDVLWPIGERSPKTLTLVLRMRVPANAKPLYSGPRKIADAVIAAKKKQAEEVGQDDE